MREETEAQWLEQGHTVSEIGIELCSLCSKFSILVNRPRSFQAGIVSMQLIYNGGLHQISYIDMDITNIDRALSLFFDIHQYKNTNIVASSSVWLPKEILLTRYILYWEASLCQ